MEEIRITLETLYDILRNEKKREDLQELEPTFHQDVVNYLKEKQALLENNQEEDELFAMGEKKKVEYELRSIKRILKEIYEKREKKIIDIALNKSRTGSDIIDTSAMLIEEKHFYSAVLEQLDLFRRGVLLHLFKGQLPQISPVSSPTPVRKVDTPIMQKTVVSEYKEYKESKESKEDKENKENKEDRNEEKPTLDMTKVKFVHPMPSFVWKDMKVYGPYDQGEEIEIFPEVAELLVRKGRAEKV